MRTSGAKPLRAYTSFNRKSGKTATRLGRLQLQLLDQMFGGWRIKPGMIFEQELRRHEGYFDGFGRRLGNRDKRRHNNRGTGVAMVDNRRRPLRAFVGLVRHRTCVK